MRAKVPLASGTVSVLVVLPEIAEASKAIALYYLNCLLL